MESEAEVDTESRIKMKQLASQRAGGRENHGITGAARVHNGRRQEATEKDSNEDSGDKSKK